MYRFQQWLATSPIASTLRTFAAIVLAMFLADGADLFAIDATDARSYIAAALAATLPTIVRALNPADTAYGAGSGKADRFDVFTEPEEEI